MGGGGKLVRDRQNRFTYDLLCKLLAHRRRNKETKKKKIFKTQKQNLNENINRKKGGEKKYQLFNTNRTKINHESNL